MKNGKGRTGGPDDKSRKKHPKMEYKMCNPEQMSRARVETKAEGSLPTVREKPKCIA